MNFIHLTLVAGLCLSSCGAQQSKESSIEGQVQNAQDRIKYTETYENGQIKIEGWNQDQKRVGLWISYYENGVRWSEDEFRDGMKDGRTVSYYPNGIMRYRGHYIEDNKAGIWQFYDESGKLLETKDFNK